MKIKCMVDTEMVNCFMSIVNWKTVEMVDTKVKQALDIIIFQMKS